MFRNQSFNRWHWRDCRRQKALLRHWSSSLGRLFKHQASTVHQAHRLSLRIMEKEVFNKLSTRTTVSAATTGRFLANSTENLSPQPKTQCLQGLELRPQVSFLLGCCSTTTLNLWQIWARYGCTWLSSGRSPGGWSQPGLHSIMSQKTKQGVVMAVPTSLSLLMLSAPLTLTEFHAVQESYNSKCKDCLLLLILLPPPQVCVPTLRLANFLN